MKYRNLGNTGLKVSEIGFGAWAIGGTGYGATDDQESLRALETAFDRGVNFFDTADTYGQGRSESILRAFLKTKLRSEIFLASKCGWDFYHGGTRKNFDSGYIRFACEESLKRLGIETIDLYQLHNPSLEILREGKALAAMKELQAAGKIRHIGVSVHTPDEAEAALQDEKVNALQLRFHLLDLRMGPVLEKARNRGAGIIVREPLAYGFLTGKYLPGHEFPKDDHRRRFTRETTQANFEKIEILKSFLLPEGVSLTKAALEFVLRFPEVSTVIAGAKTPAQVFENTEVSDKPVLSEETAMRLERLVEAEPVFKRGYF